MGRSSGMGLDVESSGAGDGVPPVFWFLLGFRVCDGPVESDNSTNVHVWSRGSCHILPSGITLTLALSHRREGGQDAVLPVLVEISVMLRSNMTGILLARGGRGGVLLQEVLAAVLKAFWTCKAA